MPGWRVILRMSGNTGQAHDRSARASQQPGANAGRRYLVRDGQGATQQQAPGLAQGCRRQPGAHRPALVVQPWIRKGRIVLEERFISVINYDMNLSLRSKNKTFLEIKDSSGLYSSMAMSAAIFSVVMAAVLVGSSTVRAGVKGNGCRADQSCHDCCDDPLHFVSHVNDRRLSCRHS